VPSAPYTGSRSTTHLSSFSYSGSHFQLPGMMHMLIFYLFVTNMFIAELKLYSARSFNRSSHVTFPGLVQLLRTSEQRSIPLRRTRPCKRLGFWRISLIAKPAGFNEQQGKTKEALINWGGMMEVESITLNIRFPGREGIPNDGMMG
jgi:hypothetical protein